MALDKLPPKATISDIAAMGVGVVASLAENHLAVVLSYLPTGE